MRPIEFRTFHKKERKMCRVISTDFKDFVTVRFPEFEDETSDFDDQMLLEEFEPLMQYTGMNNFDGTKIFEGDILQGEERGEFGSILSKWLGVVYWDSELCGFYIKDDLGDTYTLDNFDFNDIVGNIHTHSKLVEFYLTEESNA